MSDHKCYNVYTPTIGEDGLEKTIESIQGQTYPNVKHTIVTDTEEGHDKVRSVIAKLKPKNTLHFVLPEKIGKDRPEYITSGIVHLVNYDYWQCLGTGDWIDVDHFHIVDNLYDQHKPDWVFTLRKIYDQHGEIICRDIFESIGFYPVWNTPNYLFVDGLSWILPRAMIQKLSAAFYKSRDQGQRTDKFVFDVFRQHYPNYMCTNEYTLNFKLNRGTPQQLAHAKQWYLTGYHDMVKRFPDGKFPWIKERRNNERR